MAATNLNTVRSVIEGRLATELAESPATVPYTHLTLPTNYPV